MHIGFIRFSRVKKCQKKHAISPFHPFELVTIPSQENGTANNSTELARKQLKQRYCKAAGEGAFAILFAYCTKSNTCSPNNPNTWKE
jgi:hypothetical protein